VHLDVAKLLIAAGADKEKANKAGQTPLHCACHYNRVSLL